MTAAQLSRHNRWPRLALAAVLVTTLAAGVYVAWPKQTGQRVIGLFSSAVGLYPGDDVKVAGVAVGTITSIEPGPADTKISMTVRPGVVLPADARAIVVAPNLVSARFVELTPVYSGGAALADGGTITLDHTGVPVEWDEVKDELTKISAQLGPGPGSLQGPLSAFVNQAADTFDGNGDSFRKALRELSQAAGRLGDSRTDLLGTVKNLHILIDALSASNEQIVQFSNHVASVSQVLADSSADLDTTLDTLNKALADVRGFLNDNNHTLIGQINRLADLTKLFSDHSDDIEQILHVAPNSLANFYNMYNPAQDSIAGILTVPNFGNPVQFICGGVFEGAGTPDYYKRAELCRQRMAPVLRRFALNYPPILFHPINSIQAYKGQIIYDTPETAAKAQTPVSQLQWQPLPGVTPPAIPSGADLSSLLLPPPVAGPPDSVQAAQSATSESLAPSPSGSQTPLLPLEPGLVPGVGG